MIALVAASWAEPLHLTDGVDLALHGFVDVGWFDVGGAGTSYRFDHTEVDGTWVYTGDPWAAMVNTQGEAADLGNDFNNLQRDDDLASGGRPTFLVNTVEQALALRSEHVDVALAVWVEPRTGSLGDLGDTVSLDRAWIGWHPLASHDLEVRAGKVESAFGLEWYTRRAPDRPTVTPSLIARYTTGTPVGLALHAVPDDHVLLDLSVTNGGTTTERFGHLTEELDTNGVPTGTGRVEIRPLGRSLLRLGISGQAGAQDGVVDVVPMWQLGADLAVDLPRIYLRAEFVRSDQDQGEPGEVDRLLATGWRVEVWGNPTPWLQPVLRVDRRDATLEVASVGNRYLSDVVRLTAGARWDASYNLFLRAELAHLWELEGEAIDDDVITTSAVFRW
ncbi:MAG: hypothetical protein H6738_18635 [Alphaproteobacteria bacterium]|nr:hypothetical protein [Alphaproteobacteria bacterium]